MSLETSQLSQVFTALGQIYRNAGQSRFQRVQEQFDTLPENFRNKILNIIHALNPGAVGNPFFLVDASTLPYLQTAIQRVAFGNFETMIGNPTVHLGVETMLHRLADRSKTHLFSHEIKAILDQWVQDARQNWVEEYLFSSLEWVYPSGYQARSIELPWLWIREPQFDANQEILNRERVSGILMEFVTEPHFQNLALDYPVSNLPPIFHADTFTSRLKKLKFSAKQEHLPSDLPFLLPSDLFLLKNLEVLEIAHNPIITLPSEISNLQALRSLDLCNTLLTSLPPEIGRLSQLEILDLSDIATLTSLPMQILDLPSSCQIDLQGTGLSDAVLGRIRDVVTAPGYHGPRISYSMGRPRTEERPMGELLKELFTLAEEEEKQFPSLLSSGQKNFESLHSWLARLSDTADYQKGGERQSDLAQKVLGYLQLAESNPHFRDKFFMNLDGASKTCGDRVALSILKIGISYRLMTMDKQNLKELAYFLVHTVWPVDMLENIARNKIPALPFFDEIEVYLAYPIKLQEKLGLKIDVEDMLYFTCSALTDQDLNEAADFVKQKQTNRSEVLRYLCENEEWEEVLKLRYPEELKKFQREAEAETESATDNCAPDEVYVQIKERLLAKRMTLTARALSN